MDGYAHYRKVREDLVTLYNLITTKHFPVVAPRSVFLTTEQLERIANNPPPGGVERFTHMTEMTCTIEKMMLAYSIGGEDFEIGFTRPGRDIPIVYETIQEYIRLWVDVKMNAYGYKTATIKELKMLENVSRSLFGIYKYYYEMEIARKYEQENNETEFELANLALGGLVYGRQTTDVSFISYIDHYHDRLSATDGRTTMYVDKDKYIEPIKHVPLTETFELPTMKHNVGNWT